jgi:hypothetical protein
LAKLKEEEKSEISNKHKSLKEASKLKVESITADIDNQINAEKESTKEPTKEPESQTTVDGTQK